MTLKIEPQDTGHVFDPSGGTWLLLSAAIHKEIEFLRDELENGNDNRLADNVNRGRLAALREILALGDPPRLTPGLAEPADYGV